MGPVNAIDAIENLWKTLFLNLRWPCFGRLNYQLGVTFLTSLGSLEGLTTLTGGAMLMFTK